MALTPQQLGIAYSRLRQGILARHFSLGRFHRANLLSLSTELGVRSSELAGKSPQDQMLARWTRLAETRENPLMWGGPLMACLAVEEALGLTPIGGPLRCMVQSMYQNYRSEGPAHGYPHRWDVSTSTRWEGDLGQSQQFLHGPDGRYDYNPDMVDPRWATLRSDDCWRELAHPRDVPFARFAQEEFFDTIRRVEPSMDELCGLVAGYAFAGRLSADPLVRDDIRTQAGRLGDYLSSSGYLLVRPSGGFTARGASGILPALELPLAKALTRVSGREHASQADFVGACVRAGVWPLLKAPYERWGAAGAALTVTAAVLAPIRTLVAEAGLSMLLDSVVSPVQLGHAVAVYAHRDCFDVKDDEAAQEFAAACLLHDLPAHRRFSIWMTGMGEFGNTWASGFPPLLGLAALDDPDRTVADAYLAWYDTWRASSSDSKARGAAKTCTAAAVACLLRGSPRDESDLARLIETSLASLGGALGADLEVIDPPKDPDDPTKHQNEPTVEYALSGLHVMTGIALGWLHADRRAKSGVPVTAVGFPTLRAGQPLAAVAVPATVAAAASLDKQLRLPLDDIQGTNSPVPGADGNFDISWEIVRPRADPPARVPPMPTSLVYDEYLNVGPANGEVRTYAVLRPGDAFEVVAQGLVNGHGPEGEAELIDDARAPVHVGLDPVRARRDALVMRINGYVIVGQQVPRQQWLYPAERMIHLRLNRAGREANAAGSYLVRVRVWSEGSSLEQFRFVSCAHRDGPDPGRSIDRIGGLNRDGTRWHLRTDEAIALHKGNWGRFFVMSSPLRGREILVANRRKKPYLRSEPNGLKGDNLSSLPACSE